MVEYSLEYNEDKEAWLHSYKLVFQYSKYTETCEKDYSMDEAAIASIGTMVDNYGS